MVHSIVDMAIIRNAYETYI